MTHQLQHRRGHGRHAGSNGGFGVRREKAGAKASGTKVLNQVSREIKKKASKLDG